MPINYCLYGNWIPCEHRESGGCGRPAGTSDKSLRVAQNAPLQVYTSKYFEVPLLYMASEKLSAELLPLSAITIFSRFLLRV